MKKTVLALEVAVAACLLWACDSDSSDLSPMTDMATSARDMGPVSDALTVDRGAVDASPGDMGGAADRGAQMDLGGVPSDMGPAMVTDMGGVPPDMGPPGNGDSGPPAMGDMGPPIVSDMGPPIVSDMGGVPPDMGPPVVGDAAMPDPQPEGLPPGYTMRCPPRMQQANPDIDENLHVTDICVVHRPVSLPFVGGVIHNIGQEMYCGVAVTRLTLNLTNGNETDNMLITIRGLVRLGVNGRSTNNCLAPGQSAPFMLVVRFRDDDAQAHIQRVNFRLQGHPEETQAPLSNMTVEAVEPEATGENRMRFVGTLRNTGGGPAGVAPFMVTFVGMLPDSLVFDYQHASGLDLDTVIPEGEALEFTTWVIGAAVEHAPLFGIILNWEDAPPAEEAPPGNEGPPEEQP